MTKTEQSRKSYNKQARNYENTHDGRVTRPLRQMLLSVIDARVILTDGPRIVIKCKRK